MIKLKDRTTVYIEQEQHFKLDVNGKEVWVSTYFKTDEFGMEDNTEIFKGKTDLTEDEEQEVLDYIADEAPEAEIEK